MTTQAIAQSVQFLIDHDGKTTAVVLTPQLWHQILSALEDGEDRALVQALKEQIADGPVAAGAVRWEEVAKDWA